MGAAENLIRQLELVPTENAMEIAGECYFQVKLSIFPQANLTPKQAHVEVGTAILPGGTAATERERLWNYATQLPPSRVARLRPFLEPGTTWEHFLENLRRRDRDVGHVELQVHVDMTGVPLVIIPDRADENGRIVPIRIFPENGQPTGPPVYLLHQVDGRSPGQQHYVGLRRLDAPARAPLSPPPAPEPRDSVVDRSLRFVEEKANEFRKKRKENNPPRSEDSATRPKRKYKTGQKRAKDLEVETQIALELLRRGIEPPQPTVNGTLTGNYLAKARRDAEVKLQAIQQARERLQHDGTPEGTLFQQRLQEGRFTPEARAAIAVAATNGLDLVLQQRAVRRQLLHCNETPADLEPRRPANGPTDKDHPADSDAPADGNDPEENAPNEILLQVPLSNNNSAHEQEGHPLAASVEQGEVRRTSRKRAAAASDRGHQCSKCGCTDSTKPDLEWIECGECKRWFHSRCVRRWIPSNGTQFQCRQCKLQQKRKK